MSEYMFHGLDSYDTPANHPVAAGFKLMFKSRWYFYFRNFGTFIRSGRCAAKGQLDKDNQIHYSNENIRLIEDCGAKLHLRGLNHLRDLNGRPVVIIGNHMSLLETAVLHAFLRPRLPFCFVIKESLFHVPFFGNIMRRLGCIAVGRENPRDDLRHVMQEGKKRLEDGVSVIIFPQSSRSAVFDEAHFNTIGVKLAKHANVPVLPLALRTDFLENGKWLKDLGPVRRKRPVWFEFGEPFPVEGSGKEEQKKVVDFITSRLTEWGCEVRRNKEEA